MSPTTDRRLVPAALLGALCLLGSLGFGCNKDETGLSAEEGAKAAAATPPVELNEVPVPPAPAADGEFLRVVRPIVERVCLCKDLACASAEMDKLSTLQPSVPELDEAGRLAERMKTCVARLSPSRSNTPSFNPDDDVAPETEDDDSEDDDESDDEADEKSNKKSDDESSDGSTGGADGGAAAGSEDATDGPGELPVETEKPSGTDGREVAPKKASYSVQMKSAVDAVCACQTLACAVKASQVTSRLEPTEAEMSVAVAEGKRLQECMRRLAAESAK